MKITTDTLAIMNDDDLYNLGRRTRNRITEVSGHSNRRSTSGRKGVLFYLQSDMCYIQREMRIRKDRHEAHEKWLLAQ